MTQNLQETISEHTQLKSELSKFEVQLTELEVSSIVNHRFVFYLYKSVLLFQAKLKFISAYEKEEVELKVDSVCEAIIQAANNQVIIYLFCISYDVTSTAYTVFIQSNFSQIA